MRPVWAVVEVLDARSCVFASPSGPSFLYQNRSMRCKAIFCPVSSAFMGVMRWVSRLKYPKEEEKFRQLFCFGCVRVWAMFDSSRARRAPRMVTIMAAVFVMMGMVIGGVFVGGMKDVISRPARMLPKASRVMGLMIVGLFSLIGMVEGVRVNPVCTKRVMRRV